MNPSSTATCTQTAATTSIHHDGQQQEYHQQTTASQPSSPQSSQSSFQDNMTLIDLLRRGHTMTVHSSPRRAMTSAAKLGNIIKDAIAVIDDDDIFNEHREEDLFGSETFLSQ